MYRDLCIPKILWSQKMIQLLNESDRLKVIEVHLPVGGDQAHSMADGVRARE
jgi:hypothetical protein